MAKIKKKGESGASRNYYTRSQAVRKLQLPLSSFRRLCILKGIYPRQPRSAKRVSKSSTPSTTFYYAKDIQYLLHEPLLAKFRDQKALAKKISRALGKNDVGGAVRLERNLTPRVKLDRIIRERYPTFVDALRDLDDALSMLYLFANLPGSVEVPAKTIARCQRLTMEFEHYLIRTHSLRKSFLSIKGIYYQATIQGQDILWLVPYKFVQSTGGDVDFRIMGTFIEFYTTLLGFVNFRLYTGIGLVYPPRFDKQSEEQGAELSAFQLEAQGEDGQAQIDDVSSTERNERAQQEADRILALPADEQQDAIKNTQTPVNGEPVPEEQIDEEPSTALDQFASIDPAADTLLQPSLTADAATAGQLFEPFTFYLSRETPRHPLEFILRAFGCKRVGWSSLPGEPGGYCGEEDGRITHQVVDRPDIPLPSPPATDEERDVNVDDDVGAAVVRKSNERVPGRTYIQPQWVWDSINAGSLQRPDLYAPGATLPPHLSPWVKARKGAYDPTVSLAEQETAAEAEMEDTVVEEGLEEASEGEEVEGVRGDEEAREMEVELEGERVARDTEEDGGMDVELAASEDEEESEDEIVANGGKVAADEDGFGGFSDDEPDVDPSNDATRAAQAELEAEALGRNIPTSTAKSGAKVARDAAQSKRSRAEREAQEDLERRKMMMPRRKRKMYEKMVYSNARKDEEAEKLRGKRRKLEKAATAKRT